MKRPITSPWSAVFTSSATITLMPLARSRASSAPEISLWSVTAIAPRPTLLAVSSSVSTGVAQSGEWSVCMCRSTWMKSRSASRRRSCGLPSVVVPARGDLARRAPRTRRPRATSRAPGAPSSMRARVAGRRSCGSRSSRSSWAASVTRVARLEQQAQLAVAQQPPRTAAGATTTGTAPPAIARSTSCGAGAVPADAATDDRRRAPGAAPRSRRPGRRAAPARAARRDSVRRGRRRRVARPDRGAASRGRAAAAAARAGRAAARRAPPRPRRRSRAGRRRARPGARSRSAPGWITR